MVDPLELLAQDDDQFGGDRCVSLLHCCCRCCCLLFEGCMPWLP